MCGEGEGDRGGSKSKSMRNEQDNAYVRRGCRREKKYEVLMRGNE